MAQAVAARTAAAARRRATDAQATRHPAAHRTQVQAIAAVHAAHIAEVTVAVVHTAAVAVTAAAEARTMVVAVADIVDNPQS